MSPLPPEDERTVMPLTPDASSATPPDVQESSSNALPAGTKLGEFEIVKVIGIGGFGIVYLAYDHSLQRRIALKEYMPSTLAERSSLSQVGVKSERHAETFQAGMRSFINEARLLAQFDHPSLLKVYRFWEANGTAYMAMPFYEGLTLTQNLRARDTPPDEAWLKSLLAPLLDALETIHVEKCFHRDIAPDNILMLADDRPLLLDFGAARRAIGGKAQAFTVILKPGYAPIEQYADVATMQQGAWTDIYALASVVHFAITGRPPAPSVARMISDPQVPLAQSAAGRYSDLFLQVIDRALAVKPEDRPQSVAELRSMLGLQSSSPQQKLTVVQPTPKSARPVGEIKSKVEEQRPKNTLTRNIVIGAVLVLAIAAGSFFVITRESEPTPPVVKAQPELKSPSNEAAVPATVPPEPMALKLPDAQAIDPIEALEQIFQARNRDHAVTVLLEKPQVRIGKDRLRFTISSSKPGYIYLLMVGSDRSHFWLLFPNSIDKNNNISSTSPLVLPRSNWRMEASGPPGTDLFVVIVSESPRDFSAAGLKPNGPFSEFPLTVTMRPEHENTSSAPVFAGKADCAVQTITACPQSFGAAMFSIEEIPAL
jgi:serine/threonine protein kinase